VRTRGGRGRKRGTAAWRRARTIAPILGLVVAVGAPSTLAASRGSAPRAQVIVMAAPGATASIERAVEHVGGVVERRLSIIGGFSAAVPADVLLTLRGLPGVVSVSANSEMQPQDATYDPATDVDSMNAVTRYTGAVDWWNTGYTGAGVDVAVIDTGVSPVEGLATPGKVLNGPDLSIESQAPNLRYLDTFGHGTFMAGLIAGHDPALTVPYADAPASAYRGIAPDARIVSVKVGTADGGTDVSQVIAAIDWVVQHAHDPGLNIRVLNLSYGTNSTQSYTVDPLAFAAEQAWKHGIVVVGLAGNGHARRRYRAGVLTVAQARSDEGGRPPRTRYPSAGAARAELVHRREPSRRAPRRPVLPGERDLASSSDRVGGGSARAPEVPVRDPGSGQGVDHQHRVSDQREVSGHRRR
jgi:subtilisin family serine protease